MAVPERLIALPDVADLGGVRFVAAGPAMSVLVGEPARSRALRDELGAAPTRARAYPRPDFDQQEPDVVVGEPGPRSTRDLTSRR